METRLLSASAFRTRYMVPVLSILAHFCGKRKGKFCATCTERGFGKGNFRRRFVEIDETGAFRDFPSSVTAYAVPPSPQGGKAFCRTPGKFARK